MISPRHSTSLSAVRRAVKNRFPVYHDLLTAVPNLFVQHVPQNLSSLFVSTIRILTYSPCISIMYYSGIEMVRTGGELLGKQVNRASGGVGKLVKRECDNEQSADESDDRPDGGRFEALVRLYLLASKLPDFEMMNLAIDALVRMVGEDGLIPAQVNLVYSSTKRGDPLRALIGDVYIYEAESSECHEFLQTPELHLDFWRDISLKYFELKDTDKSIGDVYGLKIGKDSGVSRCDYYQRHINDEVEIVPPPTAGATTISRSDHAPVLPRAYGRDSHHLTAAASDVAAQRNGPTSSRASSQSGRSSTAATLSDTEKRAPTAPQSSFVELVRQSLLSKLPSDMSQQRRKHLLVALGDRLAQATSYFAGEYILTPSRTCP
jgi:hypothetical protein